MTEPAISFAAAFEAASRPGGPSPETVGQVFRAIFAGKWPPVQVAGILVALRFAGESPELLAAAAGALRAVMLPVEHSFPVLLDTCGTGGDHSSTLNLSTGAALIAAAAGVPVAKHGNRAATSRTGSADVLEALGVALDVPPERQSEVLRTVGLSFLFAQAHHPAMLHAMPVRRELGIRTLLNCLGPLANPARATHQLVGAFDQTARARLAGALRVLGTKRAWVVRSADGMDEVSPYATTHVTQVTPSGLEEFEIAPEDFGIARSRAGSTDGGEAGENARVLEAILRGQAHPAVDAFILNAAAALVVGEGLRPRQAADQARALLESGVAFTTLERLRACTVRLRTLGS